MVDELDALSNVCTDLVSLKKLEPGVAHLLRECRAGAWMPVKNLYAAAGQSYQASEHEPLAAWLPSPSDPGYAVIVFFEDETKWSLTAEYNSRRLLGERHPTSAAVAG